MSSDWESGSDDPLDIERRTRQREQTRISILDTHTEPTETDLQNEFNIHFHDAFHDGFIEGLAASAQALSLSQ